MIHIIQILMPIFIIIFLGYVGGERTLGADGVKALNMFVYYFAFPALIINGLVNRSLDQILNEKYILGYFGAGLLIFSLMMLGHKSINVKHRTLVALSASFLNCGYIGIPLITALFGNEMLLPAIIATVVSLFHLLLVILFLEIRAKKYDKNSEKNFFHILINSFLNPMIICFIVGLIISGLEIKLPDSILSVLKLLSGACVPCALFAIGHNLVCTKEQYGINLKAITDVFIFKNFIQGIFTWIFLLSLHVDSQWIAVGVLMSSLSTGLVLPIMATKYNTYQTEAPQAVFFTTIASILSLSTWVFSLQHMYPNLVWK